VLSFAPAVDLRSGGMAAGTRSAVRILAGAADSRTTAEPSTGV
jgi:hypothetical protein